MKFFQTLVLYTVFIAAPACSEESNSSDSSSTSTNRSTKEATIQAPPTGFRTNMAFSADIDTDVLADKVAHQHYQTPTEKEIEQHLRSQTDFERYLTTLDPYSKYVSAEKVQYTLKRRTLPRNGIGLDIMESNGKLLALPIKGGALYRAGLKTPHYLNAINGKSLRFTDFESYRFLADMKQNEKYTVEVIENNFSTKSTYKAAVELTKRPLHAVHKEGKTVVLSIKEFSLDIQRYLHSFFEKNKKMNHLVLDFRHSIGGSPYFTIDALSYFLTPEKKVATYHSKATKDKEFFTSPVPHSLKASTKVTVLVSEFTASSTELFIRALQHYRPKITIIGKPTAGKCLAQNSFPLSNDDVLVLSVYDLLPPDGESCEGKPIEVDQRIEDIELMPLKQVLKTIL